MKYTVVCHKLGEMPTKHPHTASNLFHAINYIITYVINVSPAYELDTDNSNDAWDIIMGELIKEKLKYIDDDDDPDFIKYLLPNGDVIEATAIDG